MHTRQQARFCKGFTLLEMVLVVFILGVLATISLTFIENEDGQVRYEQSLRKMDVILSAIVTKRDYRGQAIVSGFVVDNGRLPTTNAVAGYSLDELVGGASLNRKAPQVPHYHWDNDADLDFESSLRVSQEGLGSTTGDDTKRHDIDSELNLRKGQAYGGYLNGLIDSSGSVKDAWGDNFKADIKNAAGNTGFPMGVIDDPTMAYQLALADHPPFSDSLSVPIKKVEKRVNINQWSSALSDLDSVASDLVSQLNSAFGVAINKPAIFSHTEYQTSCEAGFADTFELVLFVYRNSSGSASSQWINYVLADQSGDDFVKTMIRREFNADEVRDSVTDIDEDRIPVGRHVIALIDKCLALSSKSDEDKTGNLACNLQAVDLDAGLQTFPSANPAAPSGFRCGYEAASTASGVSDPRDSRKLIYTYLDVFPNAAPVTPILNGLN